MALDHPLAGIRVLDLSGLLPGPFCSRILADFGAEVIRVERPGGGDWSRHVPPLRDGRSVLFDSLNRGKKSLTLDLKTEEGRAIFLRLVEDADVLLETFRPGVMERLGIGYAALAARHPRLVYCSLTGYGQEGPYRDRAGHDLNYIALTGLLALSGHAGEAPAIPGAPIADLAGGLWAAIGILTLLFQRAASGSGGRADASLLGAALACLPVALASAVGGEAGAPRQGMLTGGLICYNVYRCADGLFLSLGALEPDFWEAFCSVAGRPDLVDRQFAPAVDGEPAFETMKELFAQRGREEWLHALREADCCCEPVLPIDAAARHPAIAALGMIAGACLAPPLELRGAGPRAAREPPAGAAADLGAHTSEILAGLGLAAGEIEDLRRRGIV